MRVLHYSLGLPPYRSGGLTRYATDLMKEQIRQGHQVSLLYPGGVGLPFGKSVLKKRDTVEGIVAYEIINPLPVPLYYGISKPLKFISDGHDEEIYDKILETIRPSVLHIHTLMGLSIGLLQAARKRGVKIVMTTHDFYGLCLKCTFINRQGKLCGGANGEKCAICNRDARSIFFLRFRNEPCVNGFKNKLKKRILALNNKAIGRADEIQQQDTEPEDILEPSHIAEYDALLSYYKQLFGFINKFHFNSVITEKQYRRSLGAGINGVVVPITNANIRDNRAVDFNSEGTLRMVYIGHSDVFKGFPLLKSVLMELLDYDWQLDVWGAGEGIDPDTNKIRFRGSYTSDQLPEIYKSCTLAVVPSQCYETFSFVTLEALSYGVPVLVSDHVGAQTLVASYDNRFIFHSREELKIKLKAMMTDREPLQAFHQRIISYPWHHEMDEHCKEISEKIYEQNKD